MHKKSIYLISILSTVSAMLTGCWDSTEVNSRSIILELAIDKNDNYQYDEHKLIGDQGIYTISYTIPDFGKLSGTESLATDMEATIEIQAPTIGASIDDLETKNKNSVSFSHVKTVLLGESLLKDPELFRRAIDGLSRDMLIAKNVPLLAVNGEAKVATRVENPEQPILGLYIMDYFNNSERATSFFKKQLMGNYIKEMDDTGVSTIPIFHMEQLEGEKENKETNNEENRKKDTERGIGGIEGTQASKEGKIQEGNVGNQEINISGAAVIHNYELVGYLTKEEVRSLLFVEGKIEKSPVVINYNNTLLTYNIKNEKSKLKFKDTPEGPTCLIEIDVEGNVSEYVSEENAKLTQQHTIKEVKNLIAEEIMKQVNVGIYRSKEMNMDFLGIGETLYRQQPKVWRKYQPTWLSTTYKDMPISIGVNVAIHSTGLEE